MGRTIQSGPIASKTKETDGQAWFHGWDFFFSTGTWTATRGAVGNYFMRHTAAAESVFVVLPLETVLQKIGNDPNLTDIYGGVGTVVGAPASESHDIRGVQITEIDLVYAIATDAIAAHSALLRQTLYANNAAPSVSTPSTLTGTLATATQAQPYMTALTVATIYVLGNNVALTGDYLEITMDSTGHATAVYDLYGAFVKFNYNLL